MAVMVRLPAPQLIKQFRPSGLYASKWRCFTDRPYDTGLQPLGRKPGRQAFRQVLDDDALGFKMTDIDDAPAVGFNIARIVVADIASDEYIRRRG